MQALPSTHVLVVDDQSAFRDLLKRMLEPAGYEVRTAADAHAALQSIAESRPAVAVLDIHMPGPNGLWLANQIRAHSPSTAIVLATSDDTVPPAESLRKGVVAYVLKPLRREAVLEAVADAFKWFAGESRLSLSQLPIPLHTHAPPHAEPGADAAPAGHARRRDRARRTSMRLLIPAALTAAAGLALYGRSTPANVVDLVAAASGQVTVEDAAGQPLTQGSGFFITPDTFVTSHHVVDGGSRATILMARSGLVLTVSGPLAFDREHDLALLKTAGQSAAWLELDVSPPSLGDSIFVYGAPLGLAGTLSQGIVSAEATDQSETLQISAPISPGSSGSPVVNARGAVIGVAAGSRVEGQGLNFAVPAWHVRRLLSTAPGQPRD